MAWNLLIGGAAGQGIDTTAAIFERLLKRAGFFVYTSRDFMSRVRGGHNFTLIRFGAETITSHSYNVDAIVAMDNETVTQHLAQLDPKGFILGDTMLTTDDKRAIKVGITQIAKDLGNPRVAGSVLVGALLGLFGLPVNDVKSVLSRFVKGDLTEINLKAVDAGYKSVKPHFTSKPGDFSQWMTISGNQALALGALSAGLKFYSAYPMSPSTTIMEYLAAHGKDCSVVVEQAEDEIAAINMAIGASFAGARAMTGTSGGGFSLQVEALGLAGMTEVPVVIANIQRPGPATGLPTRTEQSDLKFVISAAQGEFPRMVIALRDHLDAFQQTRRAFEIAEKYRIPVILLGDQYLADVTATIEPFTVPEPFVSERLLPGNPKSFVRADSDEHDDNGMITESAEIRKQNVDRRMGKIKLIKSELQEPRLIGPKDCQTLLIGWGSLQGPLTEAVDLLNQKQPGHYGALVFGDIFPLPVKRIEKMAATAKRLINVEQNATGQLAGLIREYTGIQCDASILKYDGRQISGEEIAARVKEASK